MSDIPEKEEPSGSEKETQKRQVRGLYQYVKIPVKALNIVIICLLVFILVMTFVGWRNGGFIVTYNSRGGTDVPAEKHPYGELLQEPEPPTREGYDFAGWFTDETRTLPWDFASTRVTESVTLYADWTQASTE